MKAGRWCAVGVAVALVGCVAPPRQSERLSERAPPPASSGPLYDYDRQIEARLGADQSAYWLLDRSRSALDARLAITDTAVSTLDIQYFIWQEDATGSLLAAHVLAAADRGVKVRLLLDDLAVSISNSDLLKLDGHPGIEVRVYNPWVSRRLLAGKAVEYLFHIRRLNHRMHNKTYIADGRFAIIGGRNIGDRYFGLYRRLVQSDLDALIAGPAASSIESSFDAYWNSGRSYPAALVQPSRVAQPLAAVRAKIAEKVAERSASLRSFPLKPADWDDYFMGLIGTFAAGETTLLYDPPDSGALSAPTLYPGFKAMVASARREVLISSPYLVPDAEFRKLLRELVARGVRVEVVTNSLATNNHAIAHTGYKRWRRDLLADGVRLYELREHAALRAEYVTPPVSATNLGLHTKAVVVDRRLVFVGSPNVDPRSMVINTEIGVVVRSEELARRLSAIIERDMAPENAWRVTLDAQGFLVWSSGKRVVYRQPARGFAQRFFEFVLNLLPLKTQI